MGGVSPESTPATGSAHASRLILELIGRSGRAPGARHRPVDRPDDARGPVRGRARVPGGASAHVNPAVGRARVQHQRRRRGQHRTGRSPRSSAAGPRPGCWRATRLSGAAWPSRRWPAPSRNMCRAGGRPARRRGGHPAGEEVRVLQPRPGPRYSLRGIAADPARHTAVYTGRGLHRATRPTARPGDRLPRRMASPTARRSTTGSAPASRCSARRGSCGALTAAWRRVPAGAGSRYARSASRRPTTRGVMQFLLVRPDQHIAWRASDPDSIER